jgi:HEAT repeat protein
MERTRQVEVELAVWTAATGPPHGSPAPLELLIDGAQAHPDPAVRRTALLALDRSDDPRVVGAALAALRDGVPRVRRQALHVLARRAPAGSEQVAPYLRVLVRTDPSPPVRRAAARALDAIGIPARAA